MSEKFSVVRHQSILRLQIHAVEESVYQLDGSDVLDA